MHDKEFEISRNDISRYFEILEWILAYFKHDFRGLLVESLSDVRRAVRFPLISSRIRARSRRAFEMSRNAFRLRSRISAYFSGWPARLSAGGRHFGSVRKRLLVRATGFRADFSRNSAISGSDSGGPFLRIRMISLESLSENSSGSCMK